jgi:peptidoglycan/xylan/chitin deacetylase (PgdA/CDA1 family)
VLKKYLITKVRSINGLIAKLVWLQLRPLRANATIVCYHRILPENRAEKPSKHIPSLSITPQTFEQHLNFYKRYHTVISLSQLHDALINHTELPKDALVITFDDGYSDFQTTALPLLRKFNLHATLFVCSDFIADTKRAIWWDIVADTINLSIDISFRFNNTSYYYNPAKDNAMIFYEQLRSLFIKATKKQQDELMAILLALTNKNIAQEQLMLSWHDIKSLSQDPLVEIGGHTESHPALSKISACSAEKEISVNKDKLDNCLSTNIKHFAYPFGTINEVSPRDHFLVQQCGYRCAVTLSKGHIQNSQDSIFSLPRFHIPGNHFSVNHLRGMTSGLEMLMASCIGNKNND